MRGDRSKQSMVPAGPLTPVLGPGPWPLVLKHWCSRAIRKKVGLLQISLNFTRWGARVELAFASGSDLGRSPP